MAVLERCQETSMNRHFIAPPSLSDAAPAGHRNRHDLHQEVCNHRSRARVPRTEFRYAAKFQRIFIEQMQALTKIRNGGRQTVTVVRKEPRKRRLIQAVDASGGGGVNNEPQPHMPIRSQECGAKTRQGGPCKVPATKNGRCRLHCGKSPVAARGRATAITRTVGGPIK